MRKSLLSVPLLLVCLSLATTAAPPVPPNVLVIVADDLGYADIGVQGQASDIRTPHIDSLAKNGVRFTDGYATNPFCAPSRAALMTGRYQQRFGFEYNSDAQTATPAYGIPRSVPTLAELLRPHGYATLAIGKWHLGYELDRQPKQRGFDGFYGHLDGFHKYSTNKDHGLTGLDGKPVRNITYTTNMFGDQADQFIHQHTSAPWFVYLAFSAVHGKIQAPEEYRDRFPEVADPKRRTLLGMMSAMDDNVGRLLETLRTTGQLERTLVVFFSDNGGLPGVNASLNTPFSGEKGNLHEGGIRVPFIMQWLGVIPPGLVYRQPVAAIDIVPTVLAAAGITATTPLDGVNLAPYLRGEKTEAPHAELYWRAKDGSGWAVRQGDWKLLCDLKAPKPQRQLFHLQNDPAESRDLAATEPKKMEELQRAWDAWNRDNIEPAWSNRPSSKSSAKKAP